MPARRAPDPVLTGLRPTKVCLVKPSALGDVTNAFPTLSALRSLWPGAEIVWVINEALRGLVDGHPEIDRVIPFARAAGPAAFVRLLDALRRERFDLAVDLQGLLRSGLMTAATLAPVRVGLADAREGGAWFYSHRVAPPGSINEARAVDRMLAVASAFGADVSKPSGRVAVGSDDRAWAEDALSSVQRP